MHVYENSICDSEFVQRIAYFDERISTLLLVFTVTYNLCILCRLFVFKKKLKHITYLLLNKRSLVDTSFRKIKIIAIDIES